MAFDVGACVPQIVQEVTLTPAAVSANSFSIQTFTPTALASLGTNMAVLVWSPATFNVGLLALQPRVTAAGTLEITFQNTTNATITPGATVFKVLVP